jgi:hypothetical protein
MKAVEDGNPRAYGATSAWLVAALGVAVIAYVGNLAISGLFGVCGYRNPGCDYGLVDLAYRVGAFGIPSVAALTTTLTLLSLVVRRPMPRIPVAGIVLILAVTIAASVMTLMSIG